jgi:adenosylcobinamide kinase/adenosylcobinamide-phosphate guanylyltransferase
MFKMKKIILITGGQRSGKSVAAEQMAMQLGLTSPGQQALPLVYMATARVEDDEFRERVHIHQQRRGPEWETIEEERQLSRHDVTGRVVLVDCLTLWLTNFFFEDEKSTSQRVNESTSLQVDESTSRRVEPDCIQRIDSLTRRPVDPLAQIKAEFDRLTAQEATFIFVTNEIGLGGTSANEVQRRFADMLGLLNQYVAARADEVYLVVSGISIKIKGV